MVSPPLRLDNQQPKPSYREQLLRAPPGRRDLTPLDEPIFKFEPDRHRARDPRDYLRSYAQSYGHPFSPEIAKWRRDFLSSSPSSIPPSSEDVESTPPSCRTEPSIPPLRPNAPTIVVLFYPRPDQSDARPIHQSASYLRRIRRIARLDEQTILYVPPSLRSAIEAMRPPGDSHWHVVDDWASIWDMPNNAYQRSNFAVLQPALFSQFDADDNNNNNNNHGVFANAGDLRPEPRYNRPHHSAVCNAKAFVMYDAVMRNPFASTRWMYADAGFLFDDGPRDNGEGGNGEPWGELFRAGGLDEAKFDRAISGASGDSGVVMGEYTHRHAGGCPTADDECWTNPDRAWKARQFIAQIYVGSSLGMLNYSVRFMRTVDEMDASGPGGGFYVGREELVVPFVALRYPNSVFSVPFFRMPAHLDYPWQFPMKLVFSRVGGPESVPPIVDPLATLYCKDGGGAGGADGESYYMPRRPALEAGGIYEGCETG